jgi:hypothetical protein
MTITRPKVFGVEILFKSECVSYATCLQAKIDYFQIGQLQFDLGRDCGSGEPKSAVGATVPVLLIAYLIF